MLRRVSGDPRRGCLMRRFSYPPVGGKTQSAKSDHDANTTRISKRPTAFNRPLFQQIHRYISSLVSDKFDKTCRCACVAIIKCKAGTQRDRETERNRE
jgi:hypothetical protein